MSAKKSITTHALTGRFNGLANRIVSDVVITSPFDPASPPSNFPRLNTRALWDTGATNSNISKATADALKLTPTGTTNVHHADGSCFKNTYIVHFLLPMDVHIYGVQVTECADIPGGVGAIIGMDIITLGDFSITNHQGKTVMSFRVPSLETVDYVLATNKMRFQGVGANMPCPCGSGKKFKKCCRDKLHSV